MKALILLVKARILRSLSSRLTLLLLCLFSMSGIASSNTIPLDPLTFQDDMAVDSIISPVNESCPGTYPIQIIIRNTGLNTLSSAVILWSINGVAQPAYTWAGNLATEATDTLTLSTLNFNTGLYSVHVSAINPNGITDPSPGDNSLTRQFTFTQVIHAWIDPIYTCTCYTPPLDILVPVKVSCFFGVNSVSLGMNYKNLALQYNGYQYINPVLQFPIVNVVTGPVYNSIRLASFATTGDMNIPDNENLIVLKFKVLCDTTTIHFDTDTTSVGFCQFSGGPDTAIYVIPAVFGDGVVMDGGPVITLQPVNQTVIAGDTAVFSCQGNTYNVPMTYQWQLSTNGGSSWNNLFNNATYAGVLTSTLSIMATTTGMNGYQYRCRLTGSCDPAYSNHALLTVNPAIISLTIPPVSSCLGDTILVPVNVDNFNPVCSFSFKLKYSSAFFDYVGYQGLNPTLPDPSHFIFSVTGDTITFTWYSFTPAGFAGEVTLFYLKFHASQAFTNSPLEWITSPAGIYYITNCIPVALNTTFSNSTITVNPLPPLHNLVTAQPANGHFCEGDTLGPNWVLVGLDLSDTGVYYALYRNDTVLPAYGSIAGTGAAFSFNTLNVPGVYTIKAYYPNACCLIPMNPSVTVVADPLPLVFNVTGGGTYCSSGVGLPVGLTGSQIGVDYILYLNGVPLDTLAGTGFVLNFGNQLAAGTYTITASTALYGTCFSAMNGNAIITISVTSLPSAASIIIGNTTPCQGATLVYSTPPIPNATSYVWTLPGGATGTSTTNSISVTFGPNAMSGNISVAGVNSCGTGIPYSYPLAIQPLPAPAGIISGPLTVCPGGNYTYTVPMITGTTSYIWNLPVGFTGSSFLNSITLTVGLNAVSGILSVNGHNNCGEGVASLLTITVDSCGSLNGIVSYLNTAFTPLNNTQLTLSQNSTLFAQATAALNGSYQFQYLPQGDYFLDASTAKPWGGVNAVDALRILKHFVGMDYLYGLYKKAGDVDASGTLNANDALLTARRFVGSISSFASGDWIFEKDTVHIIGTTAVTKDLGGLCYGDVDGSNVPAAKLEHNISLLQSGEIQSGGKDLQEIPVFLRSSVETASASLIFKLNSAGISIEDVTSDHEGMLVFHQSGDELRIAWYSLLPIKAGKAISLMSLWIKYTDNQNSSILSSDWLNLKTQSLVTDLEGQAQSSTVLTYPKLSHNNNTLELGQNQPNPFSLTSDIPYYIPGSGRVVIEVFNVLGRKVMTLLDEDQSGGQHHIILDGAALGEGIYIYKLNYYGDSVYLSASRELIILN